MLVEFVLLLWPSFQACGARAVPPVSWIFRLPSVRWVLFFLALLRLQPGRGAERFAAAVCQYWARWRPISRLCFCS